MKLVIAGKPSVDMALAKALGVTGKKNGYMEGYGSPVETSERSSEAPPTEPTGETDYIISWCVGLDLRMLTVMMKGIGSGTLMIFR